MSRSLSLSILDLVPVRSTQTTADAIAAAVELARRADDLGFTRYWVAEHHNMPTVAATSPAVLISHLASATTTIRVGSGGVMLLNHAPLAIAEQFALLEAMHPGRIDLGLGRAPGSDPYTSHILRKQPGNERDASEQFPGDVQTVAALLGSDAHPITNPMDALTQPGITMPLRDRDYELRATPRAASAPPIWLLGSSHYSAELAARLGMPYVYAHHFGQPGIESALNVYKRLFTPSLVLDAPKTFLTTNVVVAPTAEEAQALALPQLITMAKLRTGKPFGPALAVEDAAEAQLSPMELDVIDDMRARWSIGTPQDIATELTKLAALYDVDELMISPVAGSYRADSVTSNASKIQTIELLAATLDQ